MQAFSGLVGLVVAASAIFVPGMVVLRLLLGNRVGMLGQLAPAPAVSALIWWLGASVAPAVIFSTWSLVLLAFGAAGCWLLLGMPRTRWPSRSAWGMAIVLVGLTLVPWVASHGFVTSTPPGVDAVTHGVFTGRILETLSLAPADVLLADRLADVPATHYYPLGLHVIAAVVAQAVPVNLALTCTMFALLGLMPMAMAALTAALTHDHRAAFAAGGVVAVTPVLTVAKVPWGGIPLLLGLIQLAGCLVLFMFVLRTRGSVLSAVRPLLALTAALAGTAVSHTSQIPAFVAFASLIALSCPAHPWRRRCFGVGTAWCASLVSVSAIGVSTLRATSSDSQTAHPFEGSIGAIPALSGAVTNSWLFGAGFAFLLLTIVGCLVWWRSLLPWGWPVAMLGGFAASLIISLTGHPVLRALTSPWYSAAWRLADLWLFAAIPLLAVLGVHIYRLLGRVPGLLTIGGLGSLSRATGVVSLAVVMAATLGSGLASNIALLRGSYANKAPVDHDLLAAGSWLAVHAPRDQRVLHDMWDGAGWLQAIDDVTMTWTVHSGAWVSDDMKAQRRAVEAAQAHRVDSATRDLYADLGVRYVLATPRRFDREPDLSIAGHGIESEAAYRPVFRSGDVVVYEVPRP